MCSPEEGSAPPELVSEQILLPKQFPMAGRRSSSIPKRAAADRWKAGRAGKLELQERRF